MKCTEFLRLLDNGGPVQEGEAAEHMLDCDACRKAFTNWQRISDGLSAMTTDEAPPFLHARIMAHVRAEADAEPAPSRFASFLRSRWLAPAAVMLVAAVLGGITLVTSFNRVVDRQHPLPAPQSQAPVKASEGGLMARKAPPAATAKKAEGELTPPPVDRLSHAPVEEAQSSSSPKVESYAKAPPAPSAEAQAAPANEAQSDAQAQQAAPLFGSSGQDAPNQVQPSPQPQAPPPPEPAIAAAGPAVRAPRSAQPSELKQKSEESSRPAMVLCLLSTLDHARFASLQLPSDTVPAPGEKWYVSILDDGGMTVTDSRGRPLDRRVSEAVTGYVSMLRLPPGRYRLTQVGS